MTREEYLRKWKKLWECVYCLVDAVHEQIPQEAPKWDDPKLLLYTANLSQLEINIHATFELIKEVLKDAKENESEQTLVFEETLLQTVPETYTSCGGA